MTRTPPRHEDGRVHDFMSAPPTAQVAALRELGLPAAVPLILVNACENRCFFCASPGTIAVPERDITTWARIEAHLRARPADVDTLWIAGNEPVLHPHFERTLALATEVGFRHVALMTSGLHLADEGALDRWTGLGLSEVAVPLYATDAALHDAVCGAVCHASITRGLDLAHARGVRLFLHTLALRRNVHELHPLARQCVERWDTTLAVAPLREKEGQFVWDAEAVPLAELAETLRQLPDDGSLTLLGMPRCVDRRRPLASHPMIEMYFRTQRREHPAACAPCLDMAVCPGLVLAQVERFGDAGVAPRTR